MPLSKRIRAGQNQIAIHERDLKAANERVEEAERSIVAAHKSLEQHRAKVKGIEKALQERRNLEHLHRQAAAEASHGAEATQLEVMFPDGITNHLPQEAKDSFKRAADLYEEGRKAEAAAEEAPARPAKEGMEIDESGGLDDQEDPAAEARIHASILTSCWGPRHGETQKGRQYCGHKWPVTSAHQCRRRRSKGSTDYRRAAEISIVTISGNFWTTHAEWMAQVGPRHLVLGQEHCLEAGRCEEDAGKLERHGWLSAVSRPRSATL